MTELGHTPTFFGALEDVHEPGRVDAMFDKIDDVKEKVHNVTDAVQAKYGIIQEKYKINEKLDEGKKYATEHPVVTLFVCCALLMCAFPIACFIAFALSSIFVTFLGCVFVEGFLLTIGGFFLVVSLCIVGFLSLIFSSFLLASWCSFHMGHRLLNYAQAKLNKGETRRNTCTSNGECTKDRGSEKHD